MISEQVHAMHAAELGFLEQSLSEEGLQAQLLDRSAGLPLHVLLLSLGKDDQERDRLINMNFVPLPDDDITHIRPLQLYTTIPCEIAPGRAEAIDRLLHAINGMVPIGHYGMNEDGEVYCRYVYTAASSRTLPFDELLEVISLFNYVVELFAARIEAAASGEMPISEILRDIEP